MERVAVRHRSAVLASCVVLAVLAPACIVPPPPPSSSGDPVVFAAGDIACAPTDPDFNGGFGRNGRCLQRAVSDQFVGVADLVLPLGDLQYESGAIGPGSSYDLTWGRAKGITRPTVGNHDYGNLGAYFAYWGSSAGVAGKGWYSFDIGAWHVVVLNSNCTQVGCGAGSEQEQWLRADLAASGAACTVATMHHPRFSSGSRHGNNTAVTPLWQALYDAGVEVVLAGHDHHYERFGEQTPAGAAEPGRGVRQFVVGVGGKESRGIGTQQTNWEFVDGANQGALRLDLHPTSYEWRWVSLDGVLRDSGSTACH